MDLSLAAATQRALVRNILSHAPVVCLQPTSKSSRALFIKRDGNLVGLGVDARHLSQLPAKDLWPLCERVQEAQRLGALEQIGMGLDAVGLLTQPRDLEVAHDVISSLRARARAENPYARRTG